MENERSSHAGPTTGGRHILRTLGFSLALVAVLAVFAFTLILPQADPTMVPAHLLLPAGADAWQAGHTAYNEGDMEAAGAYWRQVPEDDEDWARAQRFLGWKLHVQEQGTPRKALPYVHRSLLADPMNGNVWQDLGRTYAATLGFGDR